MDRDRDQAHLPGIRGLHDGRSVGTVRRPYTLPPLSTRFASSLREWMPSLAYMRESFVSTVFGVSNNAAAISLFERPSATNSAIRRSLGVSWRDPGARPPTRASSAFAFSAQSGVPSRSNSRKTSLGGRLRQSPECRTRSSLLAGRAPG